MDPARSNISDARYPSSQTAGHTRAHLTLNPLITTVKSSHAFTTSLFRVVLISACKCKCVEEKGPSSLPA